MTDRLFILRIKDADELNEDGIKYILDISKIQTLGENGLVYANVETGPEVVEYDSPTYGRHIYIEETG